MDGFVAIGGCDKNMPGCADGHGAAESPGGVRLWRNDSARLPHNGQRTARIDIVSVFEAVGQHATGKIDDDGLQAVESCAIPGPGSCGGMYTANTMASAIEALGMSLPNSSAQNAISPAKKDDCRRAGAAVVQMLKNGIRPLDIMTKKAFENAITVVIALGGSTNAVLHLLAIAHAAKVKLSIDDFTRIGKRVPVLADLKPSGKHLMSELVAIGGIRPLMKTLLDNGLLHGDCLTVTGQTMAQTLKGVKPYLQEPDHHPPARQSDQRRTAISSSSTATSRPKARSRKSPARKDCAFTGKAIVFEGEEKALKAILKGTVKTGHVIVVRSEGPKGGPGMREMLSPTSAIMGRVSARTSRSSPTAVSAAAATASSSATSRPKPTSADRLNNTKLNESTRT